MIPYIHIIIFMDSEIDGQRSSSVPFNYKYLMIIFMVIKYIWEQYINVRQLKRNLIKEMPHELRVYNISPNEFLLSQSYSFDKMYTSQDLESSFEMLALSIRMGVDCLSIMCNVLPFIWYNVNIIFPFISMESEFQRAVGFVLIEAFKSKAFDVPIIAYQTFIIEKKYNFTNKTFQLFVYDLFVEGVLMIIIFPPIIYGYLQVVEFGGEHFYFSLQIFVIVITIVLTWIHPNLIAPLFNKFTELKNSHAQMKLKISEIANKVHITINNIYVMNSSVRTAHSNAYFYGIGTSKIIVLYDSLLKSLTEQETIAVITHQMGHSHYLHSLKKLIIYLLQVLSMFYIFAHFIKNEQVFYSFGFHQKTVFIGTALFFHLFQPLTSVFNTILLMMNRKFEFQADNFACELGYGNELKNGLIKLFKESTATVKPDILYAWLKHSHPNIHERIDNINAECEKIKKKQSENGGFMRRRRSNRVESMANASGGPLGSSSNYKSENNKKNESNSESSDYYDSEYSSFSSSLSLSGLSIQSRAGEGR